MSKFLVTLFVHLLLKRSAKIVLNAFHVSLLGNLAKVRLHVAYSTSQRSSAKIYVTFGRQCLENLYQFKAFTESIQSEVRKKALLEIQ